MNELLAQAYGTSDNIAANQNFGMEKSAEAALLEELEKVAAAEGIDLGEFTDCVPRSVFLDVQFSLELFWIDQTNVLVVGNQKAFKVSHNSLKRVGNAMRSWGGGMYIPPPQYAI